MKWLLLLVLFSIEVSTFGQVKVHTYDGECVLIGQIDTTQISERQVQGIARYLLRPIELTMPFLATRPADTSYLDEVAIRNEYLTISTAFSQFSFPQLPFWDSIKNIRTEELNQRFKLQLLAVQALRNPQLLTKISLCDSCMLETFPLTESTAVLVHYWEIFNAEELKIAADPIGLERGFTIQKNSGNVELWARIEWMRYKWWNCILNQNQSKLVTNDLVIAFEKLFIEVERTCL